MRRLYAWFLSTTVIASVVATVAGCGSPARGLTAPTAPAATPATGIALKSLMVQGPLLLTAIGQTSPLVAIATFDNLTRITGTVDGTFGYLNLDLQQGEKSWTIHNR